MANEQETPAGGTVGGLPQSNALAEASAAGDSLAELFSRDPFSLAKQDRLRIVEALRAQRVRWEAAEAAGQKSKPAKAIAGKAASLVTSQKAEDLGI